MRRPNVLILALIVLIGAFHLATLRLGHEWGDDFSLYVAHTRNLVEGRAYADTGYIYNPHCASLSPRTYPPVFPLLLAPIYHAFGMDLMAMKAFTVLLLVVFLGVFAVILHRRLPRAYVLACLLFVGLNPFVWQFKDRLLSDIPFLLFSYLALLLMERGCEVETRRTRWTLGLLAGLAAYLAFGTRTVGVVLVPALVAWELWRYRRTSAVSVAATASFTAGVLLQYWFFPADGSYLDQLVLDPALYARVALSLVRVMGMFFENGYSNALRIVLYVGLLILACLAYLRRLSVRASVYESFVVLTLLVLILWPSAEWNPRFLLPLLPLFFYYICQGLRQLSRERRRLEVAAVAALTLLVLASYAACYTRIETGPFREGVSSPESVALFDYVRAHTRPDDVFIFQKPRALALYTSRRAAAHHIPPNDEHLQRYLREIGATHLIVCRQFPSSRAVLEPFLERHASQFAMVYANDVFTVYSIYRAEPSSRRSAP